MNENLQAIKAGLEKVESIKNRRGQLETERADLIAKVETLTAAAAAGDAKAAINLTVAKARLESALPADLNRCEVEFNVEIAGLRSQIETLRIPIAHAYNAEYNRMMGVVQKFMEQYLSHEEAHFVDETSRQIVLKSKTVKELDSLLSIYSSPRLLHEGSPQNVIYRAENALKTLSDVI